MLIYDITATYIKGMKKYPSVSDFDFTWLRTHENGDGMAISEIKMHSHLGTHIDSPLHFIENGRCLSDISLDVLCGQTQMIDARGIDNIDVPFLEKIDICAQRILFKTDTHSSKNKKGSVYFTKDACKYIVDKNILLVGTDAFNVDETGDKNRIAHTALLGNDVVILEGIVADDVPEGVYQMYCLPLKVHGLEAAPARVILTEI